MSSTSISADGKFSVSFTVKNTGSVDGREVAQVYISDPVSTLPRPVRELKGFRRVSLRPGERQTVRFTLRAEDLAFYGADMRRVVEPGTHTLWAGGSSAATLERRVRLTGDTVVVAPAPPRYR